jgi:hypothetical protein
MAAARFAIIMVVALASAETTVGIAEASATRRLPRLEAPVEARVLEGFEEAGWGEDVRVAVGAARLQQQHARGGVGGQAVGQRSRRSRRRR